MRLQGQGRPREGVTFESQTAFRFGRSSSILQSWSKTHPVFQTFLSPTAYGQKPVATGQTSYQEAKVPKSDLSH
jgi:hypothetical protein